MTPIIILAAIVLVPVAVLLFLRVNAALVFLSLCLGNVLVQFVANDATDLLSLHADKVPVQAAAAINSGNNTVKLILLLLPVVLTTFFMVRTVHGHSKRLLNVLPAAGVGLLGSLLVVPLLPEDIRQGITDSSLWGQVSKAQVLIVGASALVCLLFLWLQRPKSGESKHSKHKT